MTNIRVGFGYDVHRLAIDKKLIIGGVHIDHTKGCIAHSDGDTLIHAIIDALLGAAGLRDIGFHFPDTDNKFKGIESTILLKKTYELLIHNKWQIVNIDSIICLQEPKLKTYIPEMISIIASMLSLTADRISIKATTTEGLGFVGKQEGISAYAVTLIEKVD